MLYRHLCLLSSKPVNHGFRKTSIFGRWNVSDVTDNLLRTIVRSVRGNVVTRTDAQEIEDGNSNKILTIWTEMSGAQNSSSRRFELAQFRRPGEQVYGRVLKVKRELEFFENWQEGISLRARVQEAVVYVLLLLNCLQSSRSKRPRAIEELELNRWLCPLSSIFVC